jgi:hypothetical protein
VPVLVLLAVALVGFGLIDHAVSSPVPVAAPSLAVVSAAAPTSAESSSWYCTGGSGTAGGSASATLYLVNATGRAVDGTVSVTNSTGGSAARPVSVPAGGETTFSPWVVEQGTWLASRVDLDGGGVTVSELVDGPLGWAMAPCASVAAPDWYFASGSTQDGSTMYVSLFNPGTTTAVVDLTFVTPSGESQPQLFQGLVVAPGALVVAGVAEYVQDQQSVSTIVQARSGQVVAEELQEYSVGATSGISLRLGTAEPQARWSLPRSVDVTGGRTTIVVFNPAPETQDVTVQVRIPSGSVAPFRSVLPPYSTWDLATSGANRVPPNTDYATTVTSTGGPGVVVDRELQSSAAGAVPQWGTVSALSAGTTDAASRRWVVANPALPSSPAVKAAAPLALAVQNPGRRAVEARVVALGGPGGRDREIAAYRIPAGDFTVIEPTALTKASGRPLLIESDGPLAAMEDASPAGMPGVVSLPAIPLGG